MKTALEVSYSYLTTQFAPTRDLSRAILKDIETELSQCFFTLGPWVERFENEFAQRHKVKHAVGTSNGTDALQMALEAMEAGPGKNVITVANTFVATVGAIVFTGATPRFVDVKDDYLMDMSHIAAPGIADEHTSCVIPVDLTGCPVPVGRSAMGTHVSLKVLRDSCQAVGAEYRGQNVASMGYASAFSLHPLKNLNVWGDGGIVTTDNDEIADRVRLLRNHGLRDRDTVEIVGRNARLDSIQAIVGFHAMKELDWINEQRRLHAKWYDEGLRGIPGIIVPSRDPDALPVYHTYVIMVDDRAKFQAYLNEWGIETKIHYPVPIHLQPGYAFLGYKKGDLPKTEYQAEHILSLPIHQYLSNEQQSHVIETIREWGRHHS